MTPILPSTPARAVERAVCIAINLSAYDIISRETVALLIQMVTNGGVTPSRFTFEITETALLQDFGTGYSSLSQVQCLPLDKLKIDRRFIIDIETNPTRKMIVRSLVALCQGAGIGCVAEGAETASQVEALRALGCNDIQGYFYARPMAEDAISSFLALQSIVQPAAGQGSGSVMDA